MLLKLTRNEFIKLFKRGKTWVILGLFITLIVGLNFVCYKMAKETEKYSSPEYRLENEKNMLSSNKDYLKEVENNLKNAKNEEEKNIYKNDIESIKYQIKANEDQIKFYEKEQNSPPKTWQEEIKAEKEQLLLNKAEIEKEQKTKYSEESIRQIDREIKLKDYYLENNIKPVDNFGFSIGENFISISGIIGFGILAAGIAVFMSDIVSGECTPPTFKFLLVQPVSRSKVILSKYITIVLAVLGLIICTQLLITVLGVGVIDGFDSLKSMVFVNEKFEFVKQGTEKIFMAIPGTGEYITYGSFLVKAFLLQSLYVVSITTFVFMISTIFKSSMLSMAISVVLSMVGTAALTIPYISRFAHLSFLSYGDVGSLLTGSMSRMTELVGLTVENGVIAMVVAIVICYTISHIRFVKRDILV